MSHSLKPWTIEPHGKGYALYSGRDHMRHGLNLLCITEPDGNWQANKRLIEAAPDLLEACKRAVTMDCVCPESDDIQNELRAAIAKATECERG